MIIISLRWRAAKCTICYGSVADFTVNNNSSALFYIILKIRIIKQQRKCEEIQRALTHFLSLIIISILTFSYYANNILIFYFYY